MDPSRADKSWARSHTLPSSPSHPLSPSSSPEFEFRTCSSPSDNCSSTSVVPADDLFYKGNLLPLHRSPRLSMVRKLLLASSSASSSSASRDSSGSSSSSDVVLFGDCNCDSSRPSSVADLEDEFSKVSLNAAVSQRSVKASSSVKRLTASARDLFRKYLRKVKQSYEKPSQKQKINQLAPSSLLLDRPKSNRSAKPAASKDFAHSFSGNLKHHKSKAMFSSCPSSIRSSPCHSGNPISYSTTGIGIGGVISSRDSSMEELQSAIQGAIAYCKNSMLQNKNDPTVSNEP